MEARDETIQRIADEARRRLGHVSAYLCEPIPNCEVLRDAKPVTLLCSWCIFDPLGPTGVYLSLTPVPGGNEHLLFHNVVHPFESDVIVDGLIPGWLYANTLELAAVLTPLFERNGSPDCPLLRRLPTHIPQAEEELLGDETRRELLLRAVAHVVDADEIEKACDFLVRYRGDPCRRTFEEMRATLLTPHATPTVRTGEPPSRGQLERWWRLITDPEHVTSEAGQMWMASIRARASAHRLPPGFTEIPSIQGRFFGLVEDGAIVGATGRFGYDRSNPIVGNASGYCRRLRCPSGHPFWFHRLGSVGSGPDQHIVDGIGLLCFGREYQTTLFFDMYHSGIPSQTPEGLSLGTTDGKGSAHHGYVDFPACFER